MFEALSALAAQEDIGRVVLFLVVPTLLVTAIGIRRSGQPYMFVVGCTLLGLSGFMLNPIADANSFADLRIWFTQHEVLVSLCILQIVIFAATGSLSWQLDDSPRSADQTETAGQWLRKTRAVRPGCATSNSLLKKGDTAAVTLALLHCLPAPILIIAMLLVEQTLLAGSAAARPEVVGRDVGLLFAVALGLLAIMVSLIPASRLALAHAFLSMLLLCTCMFLPLLQDPLPETAMLDDAASMLLAAQVLPVLLLVVLIGYRFAPAGSAGSRAAG